MLNGFQCSRHLLLHAQFNAFSFSFLYRRCCYFSYFSQASKKKHKKTQTSSKNFFFFLLHSVLVSSTFLCFIFMLAFRRINSLISTTTSYSVKFHSRNFQVASYLQASVVSPCPVHPQVNKSLATKFSKEVSASADSLEASLKMNHSSLSNKETFHLAKKQIQCKESLPNAANVLSAPHYNKQLL